MLQVNQLVGFWGGVKTPVDVTYISGSGLTFSASASSGGVDINAGAEDASRYIYLCITWERDRTVASVTVEGNACTKAAGALNSGPSPDIGADIWYVNLPTGTTNQTIVVTLNSSDSTSAFRVDAYRAVNVATPAADTDTATGSSITQTTATIDVPVAGAGLALRMSSSSSATHTWTGVTEDSDGSTDGNLTHTTAHAEFAAGSAALATVATSSVITNGAHVAVAIG